MPQLVPSLLRQELARLAEEGSRIDGRGQWDSRDVSLETDCLYNAEGSAKVVVGGTIVYAGVKFELRTPWPDRPTQGSLMCGAELRPVAGRKYEPGPPSPESIELGRVVDRGIRESGCIDMESLCIVPGEKVWGVMIDIHVLSDQGNIFDACGLAAIAASHEGTLTCMARFCSNRAWSSTCGRQLINASERFRRHTLSPCSFNRACIINCVEKVHLHSI